MSISSELKAKYGTMLLSEQVVAKELGVSKKAVAELISSGVLPALSVSGKSFVSVVALAEMLGEKEPTHSGQQASGLIPIEELSCGQQNPADDESEDIPMTYTGTVSTLKDGRFMVQINKGKKRDGSRDRESKSFKDKILAQKYLDDRLAKLNGIKSVQVPAVLPMVQTYAMPVVNMATYTEKTFEEYAVDTLNGGVGKAASRTVEGYRTSLISVCKYIGKKKMVDITTSELRKMYEELSFYYLKSSLKKAFNTTKMIFEIGLQNNDIPSTPFATLKCPRSRKVADNERTPYTEEELKTILTLSKEYHNPMLYPIFAVVECTGMRPGELRGLEWNRFNSEEKTIKIVQAATKEYGEIEEIGKKTKSKEIVSVTKNIYGVRTLKLSDLAVQALLDWKKELNTCNPAMKNSKFIFPSQEGDFKKESAVKCLIQRFVKKVGIEDMGITLYRFRHTMCTRLILEGLPVPVIQRIMGDDTIDIIMKTYTHVTQEQALASCGDYYDKLNQTHLHIAQEWG